ncbi:BC1872 family protein [Paenibacillus urinalis]|uniref:BC1872 family protein n=1 Tax=Paenibacillus urinalis TaxID=521520 RepID=UPI00196158EC
MSERVITNAEILAEPPGRELDAYIAIKVMGFKEITIVGSHYFTDPIDTQVKPYSTDISAAWEVEEQIKELGLTVEYTGSLKQVVLGTGEYVGMFDFIHATAEQRCKAALLAVIGGSKDE